MSNLNDKHVSMFFGNKELDKIEMKKHDLYFMMISKAFYNKHFHYLIKNVKCWYFI